MTRLEHDHRKHRRIVRVWHPAPGADLWHGTYANAPVTTGDAAVQWHDGETHTL